MCLSSQLHQHVYEKVSLINHLIKIRPGLGFRILAFLVAGIVVERRAEERVVRVLGIQEGRDDRARHHDFRLGPGHRNRVDFHVVLTVDRAQILPVGRIEQRAQIVVYVTRHYDRRAAVCFQVNLTLDSLRLDKNKNQNTLSSPFYH